MNFLKPVSPRPLGFFRVTVSLLALMQLLILFPYLQQLYGNYGFIQWAIIETESDTWLPSIGKLCLSLSDLGLASGSCVPLVFILYGLSLTGLLIGWKTRWFAVASWLLHTITVNSGYISLYGVDTMLQICLFYFIWMPVGNAFSVDTRRNPDRLMDSFGAALSLRVLQIHLCIIYLNTSIAKMSSYQWWNGEAIWRAFMQPQFSQFDYSWMANYPWIPMLLGWGTLILEGGYALFIWPRKTRRIWLYGIISLHMGIAAFMGLWLFATIMIIMNLSAFGGFLFQPEEQFKAGLSKKQVI